MQSPVYQTQAIGRFSMQRFYIHRLALLLSIGALAVVAQMDRAPCAGKRAYYLNRH